MGKTSRIPGFHKLSVDERLSAVAEFAGLSDDEVALLKKRGHVDIETANRMIENVIGTFELPLGIAANMIINGKEYLIPILVEESSVVAGVTYAARMSRSGGGFVTSNTGPVMIAQIQAVNVPDPNGARLRIYEEKEEILRLANEQDPILVNMGGGAKDIDVRVIETACGQMVIVHLIVDTRDAMGANAVNTMAEALAPYVGQ
jgi:hydroxymethylglutaryl-CoA reductase